MPIEKIGNGFGILVINKKGQILFGKRHEDPEKAKSALHGEGTWTFPGGKQRPGERIKEGACRELLEEIGAEVTEDTLSIICLNEDILPDVHFNTVGILLKDFEGPVEIMEPEEITTWEWFDADNLPKNMFFASEKILTCYNSGTFHLS